MLYMIFQFRAFRHHSPQVDLFIGFIFAGYAWTITCQFCILPIVADNEKKKERECHPTMRKRRDEFVFLSLIADRHTINGEQYFLRHIVCSYN